MKKNQSTSRKTALAAIVLVAIAAIFALVYFQLKPQTTAGAKTIYVEIIKTQGDQKSIDIRTDAQYLRQALEEQDLIQGEESAYGLFVTTVDGVTADDSRQEWWLFTKDGESLAAGIDATPIYNGDRYEITLVTGY